MPKAMVSDGRSIDRFIPPQLRNTFYKNSNAQCKYAINDGIGGYDFTTNGLVFYAPLWALQGSTFSSVDAYKHTCTLVSAPTWGIQGRTFATDDSININPALTPLAATTTGTFETWVKFVDVTPADVEMIVCFGDTDALEMIRYYLAADGKINAVCYDGGVLQWATATDAALLTANVFAHIALVQDGTSPILVVNGVQVAQTFTTTTDKTKWFANCTGIDNGRIGSRLAQGIAEGQFLNGTVGECRLYGNRALSVAGLMRNCQATKWRY